MRDLRNLITSAEQLSVREKRALPLVLGMLRGGVVPALKLKTYQALLELRAKRKAFGMIVVLGWRREWSGVHASVPDAGQDLFDKHRFSFPDHSLSEYVERIGRTSEFDGAILINRDGIVAASGVYLENVSAKRIAVKLHGNRAEDLSEAFGFAIKVHTRHLAAIAASYTLKGTTIFTVSEEDSSVRVFEKGRIAWSTVAREADTIVRELKK